MFRVLRADGSVAAESENFNQIMEFLLDLCAANTPWIAPDDNSFIIGLDCFSGSYRVVKVLANDPESIFDLDSEEVIPTKIVDCDLFQQ